MKTIGYISSLVHMWKWHKLDIFGIKISDLELSDRDKKVVYGLHMSERNLMCEYSSWISRWFLGFRKRYPGQSIWADFNVESYTWTFFLRNTPLINNVTKFINFHLHGCQTYMFEVEYSGRSTGHDSNQLVMGMIVSRTQIDKNVFIPSFPYNNHTNLVQSKCI